MRMCVPLRGRVHRSLEARADLNVVSDGRHSLDEEERHERKRKKRLGLPLSPSLVGLLLIRL